MDTIISNAPADTVEAGRRLAASLAPGDTVALSGDLGAGKTLFVRGLAAGLGCPGDVTSPTFTIAHEYPGGRIPLLHLDLYRIESEPDALARGLDEFFRPDAATAVEWADRLPQLLPKPAFRVRIAATGPGTRQITIDRSQRL